MTTAQALLLFLGAPLAIAGLITELRPRPRGALRR
jgi:hypothetical protein